MKKFWPVGLALAATLAIVPIAKADSYYTVNIGGTDISGTAALTVAASGEITSGTFTFTTLGTAKSVSGSLVPDGLSFGVPDYYDPATSSFTTLEPSDGLSFDNIFTSTGSFHVDQYGILIAVPDGYVNIFFGGSGDLWTEYNYATGTWTPGDEESNPATLYTNLTPSPEPSSLLLLGTGLLALAGLLFWKVKPNLVQTV